MKKKNVVKREVREKKTLQRNRIRPIRSSKPVVAPQVETPKPVQEPANVESEQPKKVKKQKTIRPIETPKVEIEQTVTVENDHNSETVQDTETANN